MEDYGTGNSVSSGQDGASLLLAGSGGSAVPGGLADTGSVTGSGNSVLVGTDGYAYVSGNANVISLSDPTGSVALDGGTGNGVFANGGAIAGGGGASFSVTGSGNTLNLEDGVSAAVYGTVNGFDAVFGSNGTIFVDQSSGAMIKGSGNVLQSVQTSALPGVAGPTSQTENAGVQSVLFVGQGLHYTDLSSYNTLVQEFAYGGFNPQTAPIGGGIQFEDSLAPWELSLDADAGVYIDDGGWDPGSEPLDPNSFDTMPSPGNSQPGNELDSAEIAYINLLDSSTGASGSDGTPTPAQPGINAATLGTPNQMQFVSGFDAGISGASQTNTPSGASPLSELGDLVGKIWNLPNTLIGVVYGGLGYLVGSVIGTDPGIGLGNNAIQFTNNPFAALGAITFGNTEVFGRSPSDVGADGNVFGNHEEAHTYQGQILGLLYIPSNILGGAASLIFGGDFHAPQNWNEVGPQQHPPVPFP